jgi:light-independent protochlorophyllide reductase subunit B
MGLEEHLLQMFREDFEFHDGAAASHLPRAQRSATAPAVQPAATQPIAEVAGVASPAQTAEPAASNATAPRWTAEGEQELKKIPFFVRSKARRNTEKFAAERGLPLISVETLYEAKAHFGR